MINTSLSTHHTASTQQLESNNAPTPIPANKAKSQHFSDILASTQRKNTAAQTTQLASQNSDKSPNAMMNTDKGNIGIDLDQYFSGEKPPTGFLNINELPPLFLPSAENIKALSAHASSRFKQMLSDYNIPAAPQTMTYDSAGGMHLPADYAYATELKQALQENTGIARELSTINALSSHYVEMQKRVPFNVEMSNANSQAAKDIIIAKYSHLLNDNHGYSSLALSFSKEGNLSVLADGASVAFS
mgnify:FL=1